MAAEIKILSAGAVQPGLVKIIETFRKETSYDVTVSFATAPSIRRRVADGENVDVAIAPLDLLNEFVKLGKFLADYVTVGRIGVGVLVHSGAPLPKIATVGEFKQTLLGAASIVYNQASTGVYLENLFDRLGIGSELKLKTTRYPDFAAVRDHLSKGNGNEIGFGATTVIIESASKGVTFAGALPAEIQNYTTYGAAVVERSGAKETARQLVRYLAAAKKLFQEAGIE